MAVKRKNEKKNKLKEMYKKAVKIKCEFCLAKDTCIFRARKEKTESMGITTYCTNTPNKPKSFIKKQKRLDKNKVKS